MISCLVLLGAGFLLLAIHPFTTYPLSLLFFGVRSKTARQVESQTIPPVDQLRCAICVCAYNEERVIEQKIRNLLALRDRHPDLELLLYVDASTDRTAEILRGYTQDIDIHFSSERRGKTYGMNLLAAKARASLLIFSDANVMMDLDCVADLQRYFIDPSIGCVCGNLSYINGAASVTAATGSLYWKLEQIIKELETRSGSMMGADGSIFAMRSSLRRTPPENIIDDMYVSLQVLTQGYRVVQASNAHAFEESVVSSGEEFRRKVRIACQAFNVHRLIWPDLRRLGGLTLYKYVSHKLLRWFTIYFLALALASFGLALVIAAQPYFALGVMALAGLGLWLGIARSITPFAQIADVLLAFAGTGFGVWRSLRGDNYQTWTPAASIRR